MQPASEVRLANPPITGLNLSDLYRAYVLGVLVMVGVFSWVDRQIFSIVLESIKAEFSFSDTQLGLVGGVAFGLFYASVGLPMAWLADRFNRKNVIGLSLALWSAMTAMCGLASSFGSLFLARMGVGIGEAGGSAPSQSLTSDYFSRERRGLAMGVLYSYIPIGYFVAFAGGAWVSQSYGWRTAFIVFGVPGIILGLIVLTTVRELPHGFSEQKTRTEGMPSLVSTIKYFLGRPSLRHIPIVGAVHGIGAFGAAVWMPAYFMRVHGMTSIEIGTRLAIIMGVMGLAGVLSGGYIADRLAARTGNARWYLWFPGIMLAVSVPFTFMVYSWPTASGSLLFYLVPALCNHILLGPIVATTQNLAGLRRRAMAAAFYSFVVNLISMGFGPLVIGMLSDVFSARYGTDSLRYSLMFLVCATCLWAALHLFLAARTLDDDLRHAKAGEIEGVTA